MKQFFFILIALIIPLVTYADIGGDFKQPDKTINFSTPSVIIADIIKYAIGIAGILGVIGITWGGIQMIMSV